MTLYETIVAKQIFDKRVSHCLVFLVETEEKDRIANTTEFISTI